MRTAATIHTLGLIDQLAPQGHRLREIYYRRQLADRIPAIEQLQVRVADLEKQLADAKANTRRLVELSVTRGEAERQRQLAANGMRERAATLAEGHDGTPTPLSEAIRAIPDPKPRF